MQIEPIEIETFAFIEDQIRTTPNDLLHARAALRQWLLVRAGELEENGSIGEALAELARCNSTDRTVAIVVLRYLAIPSLIPEPNGTNQIIRSVVEISERAVPEVCSFLRVEPKSQNYEKFNQLIAAHAKACELLAPITENYGDIDALLSGRKAMLGALNHSFVKAYGEPFQIADLRNAIEGVFSRLKRLASLDATFLQDYEECQRSIVDARATASENASFISEDFLVVFLKNTENLLSNYLSSVRARFNTKIARGGSPGTELQKRYPLHEEGREFRLAIPLRNEGPGMATDVRVNAITEGDSVYITSQSLILGNVLPGDFSVVLDAMVMSACAGFSGILHIEWGEIGNPTKQSETFEFKAIAQSGGINWPDLAYWTPYSTDVAEGSDFIGRTDKIKLLASKLLRSPMEPFYVTGQKRVGKTSLAIAAADFAVANAPQDHLHYHYILWGDVAHADPLTSVRQIGQSIDAFIRKHLPPGVQSDVGDYNGTLAPLVTLSDLALRLTPSKKFAIIIDEFDEIPQELYLQGNLADTFFANLRAISRRKNICLALVGGENMSYIMTRQGQRLNNLSRINISYFSRNSEWSDFQQMVRKPSDGTLNWHDDAISEVFNVTNGNPYYTKLVCAGVVRASVAGRDADITPLEVKAATEAEVSALGSNSFAHLWQDGIPRSANEREPDILRRSRLLVAVARCLREPKKLTASNIAERIASPDLAATEVPAILHDFQKREVLSEQGGVYSFVLPIFRMWLADVGATQLVADTLSEDLARSSLAEENAANVRSEEVVALAKKWPTYRGKQIGTDEIRAWYQQAGNILDQRILFEILKKLRVFSEAHVRERLKTAYGFLRGELPVPITRRRNERRSDVLVTYVDGPGKSGASYASLYAEENGIAARCVIAHEGFGKQFELHVQEFGSASAVIVIDDIAATGKSLSEKIDKFVSENRGVLEAVKLRIVSLVATPEAQERIARRLSKIDGIDIEFRACEILGNDARAFPEDKSGWASEEEWERARALCVQIGSRIYKSSPLGYGGLGLLVVFPTTAPNNTLPIIHSYSKAGASIPWAPLFLRVTH